MAETYQITLKIANTFFAAGSPFSGDGIPHAFVTVSGPGLDSPVTVGFYPARSGQAMGPGAVRNDAYYFNGSTIGEHPYDTSYTFDISSQQAYNALTFIAAVSNSPGNYLLLGSADKSNFILEDGYQCTGFARDVLKAAGIEGRPLSDGATLWSKYPGMMVLEFAGFSSNQLEPYRSTVGAHDLENLVSSIYRGIRIHDRSDRTPGLPFESDWPITPPADLGTSTRDSTALITFTGNHSATLLNGGTLSDLWLIQQNNPDGFTSAQDFYLAVLASNPQITSINNIHAGQTIYLPQRQADGAITYHYANGASINANAKTGEYYMSVPDGNGGVLVYAREAAVNGGYVLRETHSDAFGNVIDEVRARQSSLTSDIELIDRTRPALIDAAFAPWAPPAPDPLVAPPNPGLGSSLIAGVSRPSYSQLFIPNDTGTGIVVKTPTAPLPDIGHLFDAEERLLREYNLGHISTNEYYAFQDFTINYSLVNHTQPTQGLNPGGSGQGLQPPLSNDFWNIPIGAFYDSQGAAFDNAPSIAAHTGVVLNFLRERMSRQELAARDTDGDGQLTFFETGGILVWRDLNENGRAEDSEITTLHQRDLVTIPENEWTLRTQGAKDGWFNDAPRAHLEPARPEPTAPQRAAPVAMAAPVRPQPPRTFAFSYSNSASDYRRLRDTDNVYYLPNGQYIAWAPNQVKINYQSPGTMVGTDGNDRFDATYYSAYGSWFNLSLLTRFYAGGGDDLVGGSARADGLYGGTGNDVLYGYAGDDNLYGEDGTDELLGHAGNDWLDGGSGNDRLFGGVGNDILHGNDGDDVLVGFNPSNDGRTYLLAGETDDDMLFGGNGNDALYGSLGNDKLDGGAGNDNLLGEAGDDQLWGGDGHDELQGGDGNDQLLGEAGDDRLFGQVGNDTLWGGAGNDFLMGFTATNEAQQALLAGQTDDDTLYGEVGNDELWGGLGNDILDGGTGNDLLDGGAGNDKLFGEAGIDKLQGGAGNDWLDGGVDNDTILGEDGNDTLFGSLGKDELQGGSGDDLLAGGAGEDKLFGQVGNDTLWGGTGNDILVGFTASNEAQQTLRAGETDDDVLYGEDGDDNLYGMVGNDILVGGSGSDLLNGGEGNDRLFGDESGPVVGDVGTASASSLFAGAIFGAVVHPTPAGGNDELQGGGGHDQLVGGSGNDRLFGQEGNDTLWGGEGDDLLMGFTANNETKQTLEAGERDDDVLHGGAGSDVLIGGLGDDALYGGTGRDELQGNQGDDFLYGEEDADNLFGQAGDDVLYGGDGDDFLMGFTASNEAQQTLAEGETDDDALYGGAGNDTLVGSWGDDWLDGGAGADVMAGGQGDDHYVANSVNDVIYEAADEGHDTVYASTTYLLGANLEDLHLLEGFAIHGTGNAQDNLIVGNSADNILDGVTGADSMVGGRGNDTYYVDHAGDQVVEQAGEGTDTVQASIGYTLGDNVENLVLLDFSKPEKGLVDGREVLVYGYPKRNELDYMQGDAVEGFLGTCALTSIANVLTQMGRPTTESEVVARAIDNGWTVSDATLPAWQLGGTNVHDQRALLDSYGIRNQVIDGYNETGLANLLRGGRGVVMALNAGALWNDAGYVGDGSVNHAVTLTGAVYAQDTGELVGFYLSDSGRGRVNDMTRFVDVATFRAAADVAGAYAIFTLDPVNLWEEDIDATGNALSNTLVGNRGHNVLSGLDGDDVLQGGAGNDTLDGGAGNDLLAGGTGNDLYRFDLGDGQDRIEEAGATPGNHDRVDFGSGIAFDALWFSRTGDDLRIEVLGSTDALTVDRWFMDDSHQVESFHTSDGLVLINRDVQRLVEAMAAFSPPAAGTASLPDAQQQVLMPLMASSWQVAGHA